MSFMGAGQSRRPVVAWGAWEKRPGAASGLATNAEALDEGLVARFVLLLDVIEQGAALKTIFSRPRREWLSFTWVLKWLVRLAIRSVRIATWTSGDPVSPTFKAYWLMSALLRSAVIDIELFPDPAPAGAGCSKDGRAGMSSRSVVS